MLLLRFIALALFASCIRAQFPSGKGIYPDLKKRPSFCFVARSPLCRQQAAAAAAATCMMQEAG